MKKLSVTLAAMAIAIISTGITPMATSVAEAKTSNQIKNENKGKQAKAKSAQKSAARKSKK